MPQYEIVRVQSRFITASDRMAAHNRASDIDWDNWDTVYLDVMDEDEALNYTVEWVGEEDVDEEV